MKKLVVGIIFTSFAAFSVICTSSVANAAGCGGNGCHSAKGSNVLLNNKQSTKLGGGHCGGNGPTANLLQKNSDKEQLPAGVGCGGNGCHGARSSNVLLKSL